MPVIINWDADLPEAVAAFLNSLSASDRNRLVLPITTLLLKLKWSDNDIETYFSNPKKCVVTDQLRLHYLY